VRRKLRRRSIDHPPVRIIELDRPLGHAQVDRTIFAVK
jgi:hypothetical protein